jgi:hypothetical protein
MNGSTFDRLAHAVVGRSPRVGRRTELSVATVAATEWLVAPTASAANKMKNKKKPCPTCPTCPERICPEPPSCPSGPFCAGKNECQAEALCQAPGAAQFCNCNLRADNGKSICGKFVFAAGSCGSCPGGYVRAVAGGRCVADFFCVIACPDPR